MNDNDAVNEEYSERVHELVRFIEALPVERRQELERQLQAPTFGLGIQPSPHCEG